MEKIENMKWTNQMRMVDILKYTAVACAEKIKSLKLRESCSSCFQNYWRGDRKNKPILKRKGKFLQDLTALVAKSCLPVFPRYSLPFMILQADDPCYSVEHLMGAEVYTLTGFPCAFFIQNGSKVFTIASFNHLVHKKIATCVIIESFVKLVTIKICFSVADMTVSLRTGKFWISKNEIAV